MKSMKSYNLIFALVSFCFSVTMHSQKLSKEEMKKQSDYELIETFRIAQESDYSKSELDKLSVLNSKIEGRETSGKILRVIGIASLAIGTSILISTTNAEDVLLARTLSTMTMGVGVVSYGVSIPLKLSAKKRRVERDFLVSKIKEELSENKYN